MSKQQIKLIIKTKIKNYLDDLIKQASISKTKLRFCTNFNRKSYFNQYPIDKVNIILKLKLNMLELKSNFKSQFNNNNTCNLCETHEDTTEHLFECEKIRENILNNNIESSLLKRDNKESYDLLMEFINIVYRTKNEIKKNSKISDNLQNIKK